ncbi:MAG: hypothetical protein V2B18_14845 [Pseudomonadota bacterium]
MDKITSFGSLPEGWDFGLGGPAPLSVRECAISIHQQGTELGLMSDSFPGTGGEIYVAFYRGADTLEIRVNLDLSLNVSLERGIGVDFEELDYMEHLGFDAATDYLKVFSESRCNLSEPYIAVNTIEDVNVSQVTASRTTMEVFRLSTQNVLLPQAWSCAGT